jgi:hypothetical protein
MLQNSSFRSNRFAFEIKIYGLTRSQSNSELYNRHCIYQRHPSSAERAIGQQVQSNVCRKKNVARQLVGGSAIDAILIEKNAY